MQTFDFTPYYRSTVGFDRLFDLARQERPIRLAPLQHREKGRRPISHHHGDRRALPPTRSNWSSTAARFWSTSQKGEQQGAEMLHRGIPSASFKQSFNLADHVKVVGANRGARSAHDRPRARGAGAAEAAAHRDRLACARSKAVEAGQSAEADRSERQEGRVNQDTRILRSRLPVPTGRPDCGEWR